MTEVSTIAESAAKELREQFLSTTQIFSLIFKSPLPQTPFGSGNKIS